MQPSVVLVIEKQFSIISGENKVRDSLLPSFPHTGRTQPEADDQLEEPLVFVAVVCMTPSPLRSAVVRYLEAAVVLVGNGKAAWDWVGSWTSGERAVLKAWGPHTRM